MKTQKSLHIPILIHQTDSLTVARDNITGKETVYMYKANGKVWKVLEYDTTSFINLYETSVYYDIDTDLVVSAYYKLAYTSDTEWYDASWHMSMIITKKIKLSRR